MSTNRKNPTLREELEELKKQFESTSSELNNLKAENESNKSKASQLDQLNQLLSTPQGIAAFEAQLSQAKTEFGIAPEPASIDTTYLTDTEQQLYNFMLDREKNWNKGLSELKNLMNEMVRTTEIERSASMGVAKVKEQIGLDLSPQQLTQVMKETGQTDPVKAVFQSMPDQAIASLRKVSTPTIEKPNHANSNQDLDIENMTAFERFRMMTENPDLVETFAQASPALPSNKETTEDEQ